MFGSLKGKKASKTTLIWMMKIYFLHACPQMYAHSSSFFSNFEGLWFVYVGFYELCWPWFVKQGYCVDNHYRV
jgi:hypothetical protein